MNSTGVQVLDRSILTTDEDPAEMARAVFSVLRRHVADGEADKVLEEMPNEIAETFMSGAAR